jgi:hypothetical protein
MLNQTQVQSFTISARAALSERYKQGSFKFGGNKVMQQVWRQ